MFVATYVTPEGVCYLRGTVWTFQDRRERATEFATVDEAKAALKKARKFMLARVYRDARIVPA
jgi:hypothetical protein